MTDCFIRAHPDSSGNLKSFRHYQLKFEKLTQEVTPGQLKLSSHTNDLYIPGRNFRPIGLMRLHSERCRVETSYFKGSNLALRIGIRILYLLATVAAKACLET